MDANVRAPLHQQCGYEHVRMRPCKELRTDHYGVNYKLFAERVVRQARTLRSDAATAHYCTVLTTPSATAAAREVHASAAIGPLAQPQLPPTTRRGAALVQVVVHDSWMR